LADEGKEKKVVHTLDNFLGLEPDSWKNSEKEPEPVKVVKAEKSEKAKAKKPRKHRSQAERDREWRIKIIEKEHKLDGKSKTINLQRCFLTRLRVSQEVWEEVRARTLESLCKWASEAEERAAKKGKKTIQMEDVI